MLSYVFSKSLAPLRKCYIVCWLQAIGEEPVTEPANIQSKHQKHQAFEAELNSNNERLHHLLQSGENLIEANQCAGNDEAVKVTL